MIKMKESQLIAMLTIVKETPDVDIWELMSASGIRVLKEKTIDLSNPFSQESISSHNANQQFNRTISKKVPPKGQRYPPGQMISINKKRAYDQ